ncbi:MAG: indolepyruvate oxidoreductase subunit beta family protein [Burkholderiales bacterium]|nr:indolepyruvate oxidoreductase subunit beta family protein [Burkholderiales bacterium]
MPSEQPIKIAILAMGGEGGGVLADWIVDLGEANGYIAQTTSVPGVAQRTGATIYYVELFPRALAEAHGAAPVLALMPLPGDVDLVLASELMEAGRAVQRGLVTADRTTLVASTHRVYAIAEKMAMGDGRVADDGLLAHCERSARRFVRFDMAQEAERSGSVISAVLFGALAATEVLPFDRAQFEATISRGGVGVQASLRAFAAGFDRGRATQEPDAMTATQAAPASATATAAASATPTTPATPRDPAIARLLQRLQAQLPESARALALEGLRRLVDYQDPAYAELYLDRLVHLAGQADHPELVGECARHLALWMSYEDTIRVADLKTRDSRFQRVQDEVRARADQPVFIEEYMHPGLPEICETLPAPLGRWLAGSGAPRRWVERATRQGRIVATTSLRGFLLLHGLAGLRRWRRGTLRYGQENAQIEAWLRRVETAARRDAMLALEIVRCQRLVKGYSDTLARGRRHFELLMQAVDAAGAALSPATLRELRDAALADDRGDGLRDALSRHALAPESTP